MTTATEVAAAAMEEARGEEERAQAIAGVVGVEEARLQGVVLVSVFGGLRVRAAARR